MLRSSSSANLIPPAGRLLVPLVIVLFIVVCFALLPALPSPKDRPPSNERWAAPHVYRPRFPAMQRSYDISLVADLDLSTYSHPDLS